MPNQKHQPKFKQTKTQIRAKIPTKKMSHPKHVNANYTH